MCDTLVIVEPGRVLFAKNSDRDPNEAQVLEWHPRKIHPSGAAVRCTWLEIPQARETYAVMVSRPFWMWGAEMGANERGVVMGNEAVFTRQPYARSGLTGMDLLRLALERADTAEAACTLIAELIETHGQGGACDQHNPNFLYHNSFIAADPGNAFVLETAGKYWAMQRITGIRAISNNLTLPGFAEQHSDRLMTAIACGRIRRPRAETLAQNVRTARDLFHLLRDHGADTEAPRYRLLNGGMAALCMHAGGVAANAQTTASWVSELVPGRVRHWATATATPCLSLFKPVSVERPADLGVLPDGRMSDAFWWKHEALHRRIMRNPGVLSTIVTAPRDALESAWVEAPPDSQDAFDEHARLMEEWASRLQNQPLPDTRPYWARRYWRGKNRACGFQE